MYLMIDIHKYHEDRPSDRLQHYIAYYQGIFFTIAETTIGDKTIDLDIISKIISGHYRASWHDLAHNLMKAKQISSNYFSNFVRLDQKMAAAKSANNPDHLELLLKESRARKATYFKSIGLWETAHYANPNKLNDSEECYTYVIRLPYSL